MKILIATKNKAKIEKYAGILSELSIDYCTLKDININVDINENGKNTTENAIIKAKAYYDITKMPVLADDSGLIIDKLPEDKQPGVFVRRHNGKELTDDEVLELYSKEIENVGGESTGTFTISIVIIDENGHTHIKETIHQRLLLSKPDINRVPGYPLSSLIYDKKVKMYMSEKQQKGIDVYKEESFKEEFEFIKNVLGGNNEK